MGSTDGMTMGAKFCIKCNKKIDMNTFVCPDCSSESFFHHDPSLPFPYEGEAQEATSATKQLKDRKEAKPLKVIDPEKLEKFQARFEKELEELEYLEWRSRQPGWRDPEVQNRMKNISATAAGVALGTTVLRTQLGSIQNAISPGDNGDSGWLGDLFN